MPSKPAFGQAAAAPVPAAPQSPGIESADGSGKPFADVGDQLPPGMQEELAQLAERAKKKKAPKKFQLPDLSPKPQPNYGYTPFCFVSYTDSGQNEEGGLDYQA